MKKFVKQQDLIFFTIVTLFWFAQYVYIPYQTTFLTLTGVSSSFTGVVIGAYGITQLLLRFPVGLFADRSGVHKPFILIGALASGLASLLRIYPSGGIGFLLANLLSGLASSMWISFMVFYMNQRANEDQQAATGRIILFNNAGMLLGFIISMLTFDYFGMKWICLLSLLAGLLAFGLGLWLKEEPVSHQPVAISELVKVLSIRRLWMFSFIALIQQGIQLTTTMSFTTQILKDLGATSLAVGLASTIYMIAAVLFSAFASAKFGGQKRPRIWIPLVLIVVSLYCFFVPRVNAIWLIFILQILPGMSTGILFSFATSEAMKGIPDEKKSTAMGFYQAFYALGMSLFPMFTGYAVTHYSIVVGYTILAGIALVGCLAVTIFYKKRQTIAVVQGRIVNGSE
ncbi:Predicted arabinose efflux permease, MFS family [Amphibacillus marinus]|uniref:Predicted arabinose efflux permease, MFS family n=1 Tax=Amphibacillus marinus TaxID=872970 RepID=A0A1H8TBP6_9BACI|nr:MFS transporter [Amphibacillus marinus]SEO88166.1 Predicted arabinose efflux permease, MFS family [Amphibacillus marinus]